MIGAGKNDLAGIGQRLDQLVGRVNEVVLADDDQYRAFDLRERGMAQLRPARTAHDGGQRLEVVAGLLCVLREQTLLLGQVAQIGSGEQLVESFGDDGRTGMVAPDETTFEYVKGRPYAPTGADWDAALEAWRALPSDPDAVFDKEVTVEAVITSFDDDKKLLKADGFLHVDGRTIYGMKEFSLRVV